MKYDCSKTAEFIHECKRICAYRCDECPLSEFDCGELDAVNDEYIGAVQKWSDEHSEDTILDELLKKYPNTPLAKNGTPHTCPHVLGYKDIALHCNCPSDCPNCWNRTKEEASK